MLPPPTLSFTLPSIHDDLVLDCRIYHPTCLNLTALPQISSPWAKKAAIVAHPYAPLGGCYDDPVVHLVATTILKQGFVVGTFNFRGAGSSKGRTSWTSKPEQNDYISLIGFMTYYMHYLCPPPLSTLPLDPAEVTSSDTELYNLTPIPSQALPPPKLRLPTVTTETQSNSLVPEKSSGIDSQPLLLMAGYSYGGLVATCLPPVDHDSVLPPFSTPILGTAHAEIRLRAHSLATQQNDLLHAQFRSMCQPHRSTSSQRRGLALGIDDNTVGSRSAIPTAIRGVRMGGEEDLRRASHESYRSRSSFSLDTPERIRKSVDRVRSITKKGTLSPRRESSHASFSASYESNLIESKSSRDIGSPGDMAKSEGQEKMEEIPGISQELRTAYLLVSPPQGIVGTLATMFSSKSKPAKGKEKEDITEDHMKFVTNPTLTIFTSDDAFVSVKKLRSWSEKLSSIGQMGHFRYREVTEGGHFWHDHEALRTMRHEINEFVQSL